MVTNIIVNNARTKTFKVLIHTWSRFAVKISSQNENLVVFVTASKNKNQTVNMTYMELYVDYNIFTFE